MRILTATLYTSGVLAGSAGIHTLLAWHSGNTVYTDILLSPLVTLRQPVADWWPALVLASLPVFAMAFSAVLRA